MKLVSHRQCVSLSRCALCRPVAVIAASMHAQGGAHASFIRPGMGIPGH